MERLNPALVEPTPSGAAELVWNILDFQNDQDIRLKGLAPPSPPGTPTAAGGFSRNRQPRSNNPSTCGPSRCDIHLADLQLAKDRFCADNLIGEGSTGCVFHAQFEDGKGTNLFFQRHEGQAVTSEDFFATMLIFYQKLYTISFLLAVVRAVLLIYNLSSVCVMPLGKDIVQVYTKSDTYHAISFNRLVPSCLVIFDLEPLSLSFDFVFCSEIFNIFLVCLDRLCHLVILCLDQHAHTLHHLESLLTISLNKLDILEEDLEYKSLRNWREIQRISLIGFLAQSVGSSNTDVLDLPCLLVLVAGTSQSRQHESRKSPTAELFEVDSGRISIRHCEY
ncbi:hypothetical protein Tco_0519770 [Tanacetum coccineum]